MVNFETVCKVVSFIGRHACKLKEGAYLAYSENKFTDAECVDLADKVKGMERCLPWTDHISESGIQESGKMLLKKDWRAARWSIIKETKPNANLWCIDLLLNATILLVQKCPTVIFNASPWVHVISVKKVVMP